MVLVFLASGCASIGTLVAVPSADRPVDAAIVDANGDGRPDVLVANAGSSTVKVLLEGPHGFFDDSYTLKLPKDAQPAAIVAGKFRANGKPTVVVANRGNDTIAIFDSLAPGAGPTKTIALGPGAAPAALAIGDVDGDGDKDLLVTSRQPSFPGCQAKGCILVFKDKGNGLAYSYAAYPVGPSETVDYNPVAIAVGDLWGGGRPEIAVVNKGTDEAVVIETKNAGFETTAGYTTLDVQSPTSVAIDDKSHALAVGNASNTGHVQRVVAPGRFKADETDNFRVASFYSGVLIVVNTKSGLVKSNGAGLSAAFDKRLKDATRLVLGPLDGDKVGGGVALIPSQDTVMIATNALWWSSPTSVDVGSVAVGSTATRVIDAKVTGVNVGFPFAPRVGGPDAGSFRVSGCADVKAPGGSCKLTVTFAPTSAGVKHAAIVVGPANSDEVHDMIDGGEPFLAWDDSSRTVTVPLTGTATTAPAGGGGSTLAVGATDDYGKFADDGGAAFFSTLREVGMTVNRMDVLWHAGQTAPDASELGFLDRSIAQAQRSGVRVVLSVYPATARDHDASQLCAFAQSLAARYPSVKDFVIGNEPNKSDFWSPVDPAAYTQLLARCYDQLHPLGATVSGGTVSARKVGSGMSPVEFIAGMGTAYKALGRSTPIMDKLSFHPYPNPDAIGKGVDAGYEWPNAGIPELDRVKQAVEDAFHGTGQPTFAGSLRLALDEVGWQAAVTGPYAALYTGTENAVTVDEAAQAQNDAALVQRAACDPLVSDLLFFHLVDQRELASGPTTGGWQSGLLRADLSRRPAFDATRGAIAAGCGGARHAWTPATKVVGGAVTLTATKQQVRVGGKTQPGLKLAIAASSDEGVAWKLTIANGKGKVVTKQGTRTARFDAKNFIAPVLVGSGSYTVTFTLTATTNSGRTVSDSLQASSG